MKEWFIYTLSEPEILDVRYVGFCTDPKKRFREHLLDRRRKPDSPKGKWIADLMASGRTPVLSIVERGGGPKWRDAERKWVSFYRDSGAALTNLAPGGHGPALGRCLSLETRARIGAANSLALRGRKQPPEVIAKRLATIAARGGVSEATREKRRASLRRALATPATKERLLKRRPRIGFRHSPETRALLGTIQRGKTLSANHRERISSALRRYYLTPQSEQVRQRIRLAHTGKTISETTRARMRAAQKGRTASPETRLKQRLAKLGKKRRG